MNTVGEGQSGMESTEQLHKPEQDHNDEDEGPAGNERQNISRQVSKNVFGRAFLDIDQTSTYLNAGRFEEAYGILFKRDQLSEELRNARFLLQYCECLMATEGDYEEPKQELKAVIATLNPLKETVLWLAKKLRKQNRHFGSILLYEIFFDIFYIESDTSVKIELLEDFVSGIKQSVNPLVENDECFDLFFRRHLLQKMYDMRATLLEIPNINTQYKCVKYGWVTHHVECCDSDNHKCIEIIMETLRYMKEILGNNALRHQIYATLCHNVATTYLKLGFDEQAVRHYKEAMNGFRLATDFQNELHRQQHLAKTGLALRRAEGNAEVIGVQFISENGGHGNGLVKRDFRGQQNCISS